MQKKKTEKQKTNRVVELCTGGKVKKALELADVKDVKDLLAVGVEFGQSGSFDLAERIFTRVIKLNPNDDKAWYNKGVALVNLGRYEEEIKCYDQALKINPNYDTVE
ncbi:MAG: tetratricopeptide repeat protein [Candidatus Zixiibacteriota bacterium]